MKKLLLILLCLPVIGFGQIVEIRDNYYSYIDENNSPFGSVGKM